MASRQTSSSGAYISQYDTEVEKRLKTLEAEIKKLKEEVASHSHKAAAVTPAPVDESLAEKVRVLEFVVRAVEPNYEKLSKKA